MAKITLADIQGANPAFKTDDFRQMVNYENTKNKGYVRFMKTTDGSFKLEKINNKIDVPLSWRSNVGEANNREMRRRFVQALDGGMKYMSTEHKDRIRDMILSSTKDGEVVTGKALSRLDVKAALDEYDQQINTQSGRQSILSNFFTEAKDKCNFHGTLEEFQKDYLCLDEYGIKLDDYTAVKDGATVQHDSMVKNETSFLTLLTQLEGRLELAQQRLELDGTLTDIAEQALSKGDGFGVHLSEEQEATLRSCLTKVLQQKQIGDVDFGLGTKGTAMTTFMKMVMPAYLQEGLQTIREFSGDTEESRKEAIRAHLGMKEVLALAEEFMVGAKKALDGKLDVAEVSDKDVNKLVRMLGQVVDETQKTGLTSFAQRELMENVRLKSQEAKSLGAQTIEQLMPYFNKESQLGKFAVAFMKEHFQAAMKERPVDVKSDVEIGKEYVMKDLKTACQLVYGERWAVGDGYYSQGENAQAFIHDMWNKCVEYANKLKGGQDMVEKLMGYTLPNILNQKIQDTAMDGTGKTRLHIDEVSYKGGIGPEEQLGRTAMVYEHFNYYIGEQLDKAMSRFEKHLQCQVKKGTMAEETQKKLLVDFSERLAQAKERTVERFFRGSPVAVIGDINDDVKIGLDKMMKTFEEEKAEAVKEMNRRVVSETMLNGTGYKDRRLLLDAQPRIREWLPEVKLDDKKVTSSLERLYFSLLADKMKELKAGRKSLDKEFVDGFKANFSKEANRLLSNVDKYSGKLVDKWSKLVAEELNARIDDPNRPGYSEYQNLPQKEREAMVEAFTKDVLVYMQDDLKQMKDKLLAHPEVYGKKDLDSLVNDLVDGDGFNSPGGKAIKAVGIERLLTVNAWMRSTKPDVDTFSKNLQMTAMKTLRAQNTGLNENEMKEIIGRMVAAEKARIEEFPFSYATGGREAFLKRVNDEVQTAVEATVKEYSKFRTEFISKIQPAMAKYGGLTDKVLQFKLIFTLKSFAKAEKLPNMKEVVNGFTALLSSSLEHIMTTNYEKFLEFSKRVTAVYDATAQPFKDTLETGLQALREAGAQDDDIAFFREHIMPKEIDDFHALCNETIDDWDKNTPEKMASEAKNRAQVSIQQYAELLAKLNPNTEQGLQSLVTGSGYGYLLEDDSVKAQLKSNMATWAANPETSQLLSEARKAKMMQVAYGVETTRPGVTNPMATLNKLQQSVKGITSNINIVVLQGKFQNTELPTAQKLFLEWLEKYNLPKTVMGSANGSKSVTLTDMAMEHFTRRVGELQQRMARQEPVDEAILSPEYLKSFVQFISENGLNVVMGEIGTEVAEQRMAEILKGENTRDLFDVSNLDNRSKLSPEEKTAVKLNNAGLQKLFQVGRERAEASLRGKVLTLEDMSRMEDEVRGAFKQNLPQLNAYTLMCQTRMDMLKQLPELARQSTRLMDEALHEYFGEDIANTKKISEQTRSNDKLGSIQKMINDLHATMAEEAKAICENKIKHALTVGYDPNTANELFPVDYPADPKDGSEPVTRLTDIFKDRAKALIGALENTKNGTYAPLIRQLKKDIQVANSKLK